MAGVRRLELSMSDPLFREVDEAVRQDQIKALWDRYGIFVIAGALLIVATVGGIKGWQYWQAQRAAEAGARFEGAQALIAEGKTGDAEAALQKLADSGPSGYQTLSRFRLAAAKVDAGQTEQAVAAYDGLSADTSIESSLRQLAGIHAASLRVDAAELSEMKTRLGKIADGSGPWRHSARELLGLAAFRAGAMAEAEKYFTAAAGDSAAPPRLRQRAEMMLALVEKPADAASGAAK